VEVGKRVGVADVPLVFFQALHRKKLTLLCVQQKIYMKIESIFFSVFLVESELVKAALNF